MFSHLHTHTLYSLLDATNKIEPLIDKVVELGQPAIAITDHGNMYGAVEFYKTAKSKGVKPIIGCECYICEDVAIKKRENTMYHLILLAKNEQGRLNLQKLVSQSTQYKFNKRPRIDFGMLKQHHEGLICMSACMAGEVSRALLNNDFGKAIDIAQKYKALFGDDYYIECQAHTAETQQGLNRQLVQVAEIVGAKYVVTCDAHYLNEEDQKYHDVFVQVGESRETGEIYTDCYIQSEEEVLAKSKSTEEYNHKALKNIQEIVDKCNVNYPLSAPIIPHTSIPSEFQSEKEYLEYLCNKGFKEKGFTTWTLDEWKEYLSKVTYDTNGVPYKTPIIEFNSVKDILKIYIDRARYELDAVTKMGFEGYYLLVHSYISSAKRRGIARGSAGGSLLAYLCGIVDIDPIKYGLYFERFIDVGALDLLKTNKITKKELKIPDVDADFSPEDRDKVMHFIISMYGEDMVVNLGLFQYMKAKTAIKDIGRIFGIPFEVTNTITKGMGDETIKEALDNGALDAYKDTYPQLFEYAENLAGLPKSFGMHPCGRVITMKEASYYNALEYVPDNDTWTLQGDMHTADDLGLVKIDLLGLRTLSVIYDVLDMIGKDYSFIAPHRIDLYDTATWHEFANGNSMLIFQFESDGMRNVLKEMHCNTIDDLTAANALYRPGSKAYIPQYIARKHGEEPITYLNDDLKPILEATYGIIVYQEQLIEIGRLAGLRNPDELRKATAKKKAKLMAKIEPELKQGLMNRSWTQEQVDQLWEDILQFAKYSFNKSHSAAYALTAYITMYLKVHYPVEFITAYVNSYDGDTEKIAKVLREAKRMGVQYKFDDWQNILSHTTCRNGIVYLGIDTLKGFGPNVADGLHEAAGQAGDTFISVLQALKKTSSIDVSHIEKMIKLGFFNKYGGSKKLCKVYKLYNDIGNRSQFDKKNLPIPEDIIKKYARETKAQYRDIDNKGLLDELCSTIPDEDTPLPEQIKDKFDLQGIIDYVNPDMMDYGLVLDLNVKYSPKLRIYCFGTGTESVYKISKKTFQYKPVSKGDFIKMNRLSRKHKSIWNGTEYIKNENEFDTWIDRYEIIPSERSD